MKEKLKKYLDKHSLLKALAVLVIKRKDRLYVNTVAEFLYNPDFLCFEPSENKVKPFLCVIQAGNKSDGFFACIRWALDGLYFCDHFGIEPIIKFAEDGLYTDNEMPGHLNPFEYFFEPTSMYSEKDINTHITVKYGSWNRMMAERLNDGVNYNINDRYILEMSRIMAKYLRFNRETQDYIDRHLNHTPVNETVIGVHIRGTDYKGNYKNHPKYVQPEDYYPFIDAALEQNVYQKIFVATDDQGFLSEFLTYYGTDKIIYLSANTRSNGVQGVHTAAADTGKYKLGLEVICDMCLLASCGGIVSGMSQVALCARIYKRSQGKSYQFDKVIDKGINKTGKRFKV